MWVGGWVGRGRVHLLSPSFPSLPPLLSLTARGEQGKGKVVCCTLTLSDVLFHMPHAPIPVIRSCSLNRSYSAPPHCPKDQSG